MNEWVSILAAVAGTGGVGGGGVFAFARWWNERQKEEREKQREHDRTILSRVEKIADDASSRTQAIADKFEASSRATTEAIRTDQRETTKLLLGVTDKMGVTVGELAKEVHSLGLAVQELRRDHNRESSTLSEIAPKPRKTGER